MRVALGTEPLRGAPCVPMEVQPNAAVLGTLRRKVSAQLETHEYKSAVFLADKLVSMSNGAEDVRAHRLSVCGECAAEWSQFATATPRRTYTHLPRPTFVPGCTNGQFLLLWRPGCWSAQNFGAPTVRVSSPCRSSAALSPQSRLRWRARSFLVAKCHVAKENWEEALQVLGDSSVRHQPVLRPTLSGHSSALWSSPCVLIRPKRMRPEARTETTGHQ